MPYLFLDAILCAAAFVLIAKQRQRLMPHFWPILLGILSIGLFTLPYPVLSTVGGVLFFCAAVWLPDSIVRKHLPRFQRQLPPIVAVLLALVVVSSAGVGLRHLHEKTLSPDELSITTQDYWKIESRVVYEAAQAILLDMDVHAEEEDAEEDTSPAPDAAASEAVKSSPRKTTRLWSFAIARVAAVLLAVFVAYQTLRQYCVDAVNRIGVLWSASRFGPPTCLVVGLGHVGMQLVRDLANESKIIAIENDKSNPNIKLARDMGVFVMELDALRRESIVEMPWRGLKEAFIVAGSDETNLRVALALKSWIAESAKARPAQGLVSTLLSPFRGLYAWLKKSETKFTCYVRLDDPVLRQVLDQAFASVSNAASNSLTFTFFNSNANAARQLVQERLALKCNRPPKNGVALYVIVGFEDMGMEVAKAIAQLAHFDNLKRSRILVLVDESKDPGYRKLEQFIIRHPRFTNPNLLPGFLRAAIPETILEIEEAANRASAQKQSQRIADASMAFSHLSQIYRQPDGEISDRERKLPKIGDVEFTNSKSSDNWESDHEGDGIEFATHCYFAEMPSCASDPLLLQKLANAAIIDDGDPVNPSVVVCLEQEDDAFVWSEIFEGAWRDHCYRNKLADTQALDANDSTRVRKINVYPWLPYGRHLRQVTTAEDTRDPAQFRMHWYRLLQIHPFGIAEDVSSVKAIRGKVRQTLADLSSQAYSSGGGKLDELQEIYPLDLYHRSNFVDQQSNAYVSDHVHIKLKLLGATGLEVRGELDLVTAEGHSEIGKSFQLDCIEGTDGCYTQPSLADPKFIPEQNSPLDTLAQTEHNRWCAELLMRNARYAKESKRQKYANLDQGVRAPDQIHCRDTLVPWSKLEEAEKLKDWYQVYYILCRLNGKLQLCNEIPSTTKLASEAE